MGPAGYNAAAREYSRHRQVHPEVLRRLLLDGGIDRASRVLEVGCGTGNYTTAIHSLHLIAPEAFHRVLARMAHALQEDPLPCVSRNVLLWGRI
jgi:16S rRNA A1518/A1519 N6-dimethyltransferase RsmA/KsgA/DIM1 with predicted DNA glycosylase/AP lyase activity